MADFALWATACETAFWDAGTFAKAYWKNRDDAVSTVIEADLVATAVQSFMATRTQWEGTSSDLLAALKMAVGEDQTKLKEWPPSARALSGRLRRAAATLRKVGIEITFDRTPGGKRTRTITVARKERGPDRPDRPDSPTAQDTNDIDRGGRDGSGTTVPPTVPLNTLKNKVWDGANGRDANLHTQTGMDTEVICVQCGRPGGNEVAFGDEIGPVWLHCECEAPWIERRMGEEGILRA
jgi:hypothetical protein